LFGSILRDVERWGSCDSCLECFKAL